MKHFFSFRIFVRSTALVVLLLSLLHAQAASPSDIEQVEMQTEPSHPELRAGLLDMLERDQVARRSLLELLPEDPAGAGNFKLENPSMEQIQIIMNVKAVEAETTAYIKSVLDEHGFPGFSMVGQDGAHAAWMLVQHADGDPDLQQRALDLMEPMVRSGQVDPSDFAHLTDRVLLARGEKQRYATQFAKDDTGVLRPRPTESPETLDQRRKAFGLLEMERHLEHLSQELGLETDAEPLPAE